jgi:hypothetical protein
MHSFSPPFVLHALTTSSLYPPIQLVLVDAQIQRDLTRRFLVFPGQGYYLGFEFPGVHPPFLVLLSRLFLLLHYISRLFLYLPDRVRSIHSPLKEQLYGFTQEEIFGKKDGEMIRGFREGPVVGFQANLLDTPWRGGADAGTPFTARAGILTGMKRIGRRDMIVLYCVDQIEKIFFQNVAEIGRWNGHSREYGAASG